jgi:hypothetical protein
VWFTWFTTVPALCFLCVLMCLLTGRMVAAPSGATMKPALWFVFVFIGLGGYPGSRPR